LLAQAAAGARATAPAEPAPGDTSLLLMYATKSSTRKLAMGTEAFIGCS
jgi:hypothetical protein